MEDLKKTQEELKKRIQELEKALKEKKMFEGYDRQKELEDMVKVALRQNKKLADKVDYLMNMLIEASQTDTEEAIEKTLASITKSQIDLLKQIDVLNKKLEEAQNYKAIVKANQEAISRVSEKISRLEELIKALPKSSQLEVVSRELKDISKELEELEKKVYESPKSVESAVQPIKKEVEMLGKRLESIEQELEEDSNLKPVVEAIKSQLGLVSSKLSSLEELLTSGRLEKSKELEEKLKAITEDLKVIEELKKKLDESAKLSREEQEKAGELLQKVKSLEDKLVKVSKWMESYPIGEVQQLTLIKQEFSKLKEELEGLKSKELREPLIEKMKAAEERIKTLPEAQESTLLLNVLRELEQKLEKAKNIDSVSEQLDEISRKLDFLTGKVEGLDSKTIKEEISELSKRISELEEKIKEKNLVPVEHVKEMHEDVKEAKKAAEKGVSDNKAIEIAKQITVPEASLKEFPELSKKLETLKEKVKQPPEELEEAIKKAKKLEEKLSDSEKEVVVAKVKVKELKEKITQPQDYEKVKSFFEKMPSNMEISFEEISSQLNIPLKRLVKVLKKLEKEGIIKLVDAGFTERLLGKKPVAVKK